jgi:F-type H+-transporting ATPase subunit b
MPQLDVTWFASQVFWLLIAFVVFYVTLARWALPQTMGVIAKRQNQMSSDLDRAQRITAEAERAKQDYERALAEARARSQQLFADAALAQKLRAESAHKAMDKQVTAMLVDAKKKIESQKKNLLDALVPASTEIAGMIVEKLTSPSSAESSTVIASEIFKTRNR